MKLDKNEQLDALQEQALNLLVSGETDTNIAERLGISRTTLWAWKNRHALFRAELNRRKNSLWIAQKEKLKTLLSQSLDILQEELEKKSLQSGCKWPLKCSTFWSPLGEFI